MRKRPLSRANGGGRRLPILVIMLNTDTALQLRIQTMLPELNERQRRLFLAAEAKGIGFGGITKVSGISGVSRVTITQGIYELEDGNRNKAALVRCRRYGGGRKSAEEKQPGIRKAFEDLMEAHTKGAPMSLLLWTSKSVRNLSAALGEIGYTASHVLVSNMLKDMGYTLQADRKDIAISSQHPDRNAQFEYINERSYDIFKNHGFVSVGISADTARFAVTTVRKWRFIVGSKKYPKAKEILITADCGGSNGYRVRLWKAELQKLANELGIEIPVFHFPPETGKWNKVEHKLFSFISKNWRGRPLVSLALIVNLIGSTKTGGGNKVDCVIDKNSYERGIAVSDDEYNAINIKKHKFHGE